MLSGCRDSGARERGIDRAGTLPVYYLSPITLPVSSGSQALLFARPLLLHPSASSASKLQSAGRAATENVSFICPGGSEERRESGHDSSTAVTPDPRKVKQPWSCAA